MLFTNVIQLKEFLPTAFGQGAKALPECRTVEGKYLHDVLGTALLEEVRTGAGTPEAPFADLVRCCRAVVAPFAMLRALPTINTKIADAGLMVTETENNRSAYQWEYNAVAASLEERGYEALEDLITFLQQHRDAFPAWADAPMNAPARFKIIRSGKELADCVMVQQAQRMFMQLMPTFEMVEIMYLIPAFGQDSFDALTDRIATGALTELDKRILPLLQQASARMALYHAALDLSVDFNELGFTIADATRESARAGRKAAPSAQLAGKAAEMRRAGDAFLSRVREFLNTNASSSWMPDYFTSSLYVSPTAAVPKLDNSRRIGFFAMR